ncbi:hypothetical protein DFR52_101512 [Hoeflea marina]|uniref:Uncharacterized protein n=1 Tax=Hoeflea marina TaxID=274592 RepID=A0A317PT57_9HYPH|nr:hypothetical protein [Hoeflea marina]PWW03824.1 hypothetical protein DFR52_101512 [Hoeflea marina]
MIHPHLPISLVEHAGPPEGMTGHAGWICGFSADADFMEAFVERFTGQGRSARADLGRTFIGLCLDRSQAQIPPGEVPGVLHLPARDDSPPYRLMHAKVALLAFRSAADDKDWALRLLVTTGNWTRQTTEDSIDLVWRLDLAAQDLLAREPVDALEQCRVDIVAARDFWRGLRQHYQSRLLEVDAKAEKAQKTQAAAFLELEHWLSRLKGNTVVTPRFIHTQQQALINQLAHRVKAHAGSQRRNNLVLGSGFWEGEPITGLPKVPSKIAKALVDASLLTQSAKITLVLESQGCAALADKGVFDSIKAAKWTLLHPFKVEGDVRRLHAKFLFSANRQGDSENCASAWVYLGSGNLTPAGFLNPPNRGGNLEAGVIMAADGLCWKLGTKSPLLPVAKVLPIDWNADISDVSVLSSGDGPPERDPLFMAASVSHMLWVPEDTFNFLSVPEGEDATRIVILGPNNEALIEDACGRFPWDGEQPAYVGTRPIDQDDSASVVLVPVLDRYGRLAARRLDPIDLEQAIELLAGFPAVPEEGDTRGAEDTPAPPDTNILAAASRRSMPDARYAIRRTMQLIEAIAQRQTMVPGADWTRWTQRLQCVLTQLGSLPQHGGNGEERAASKGMTRGILVEALLPLEINPLSCLRERPFLPDHVKRGSTEFLALDEALRAVEANWGVTEFVGLECGVSDAG